MHLIDLKAASAHSTSSKGLHNLSLLPLTIRIQYEANGPLTTSLANPRSTTLSSAGNARGGGATTARAGTRIRAGARHVLGTDVLARGAGMVRSVGGAVEGQRTVAGDVLLVGDLEPLGEAWETTCFGLLIERDAD